MKKIFPFILLVITVSCNLNAPPNDKVPGKLDSIKVQRDSGTAIRLFKGLYRKHYAHFTDCSDKMTYVLQNTEQLDSLYDQLLPDAYTDQAIYVEMNASLDPADKGAILFHDNVKAEQKSHKNNCFFSEYWIFGTEPFWTIQISKEEDLIDFYDPMAQKTIHFVYAEPKIKAGVTYYDATDGESTISIRIKKEKCSGAIDPQYDYSAEVKLNGKDYHGCAEAYYKVVAENAIQ